MRAMKSNLLTSWISNIPRGFSSLPSCAESSADVNALVLSSSRCDLSELCSFEIFGACGGLTAEVLDLGASVMLETLSLL